MQERRGTGGGGLSNGGGLPSPISHPARQRAAGFATAAAAFPDLHARHSLPRRQRAWRDDDGSGGRQVWTAGALRARHRRRRPPFLDGAAHTPSSTPRQRGWLDRLGRRCPAPIRCRRQRI
ncbi:hypothetical protein OsI_07187 [Oryza sativa Indica Group]|uniref:Uncharacterized protein n=1 Tax=Oryza sativa subsp. indica TaxID=39946 RepID=B8AHZ1_ORYSI|nr:hypothetical protein OsI_07187 [Oryza sativa Indica Group]